MRRDVAVAVRVDLADQFISLLDNVGESRNGRNVWRSVRSIVWWSERFLGFVLVLQNRISLIEVCVRDKIVFSSILRSFSMQSRKNGLLVLDYLHLKFQEFYLIR